MVPQLNTKHRIVVDFETYYSRRDKYSLSSMTAVEYIMDPRFEVIMVSIKVDNEPTVWMDGKNNILLSNYLRSLPWSEATAVAHNGAFFDFLILYWIFGIVPQKYADTLLMARPLLGAKERASLAALCKFFGLTSKGNAVTLADGQRRAGISDAFMADYAAYCCGDTDRCAEIFDRLVGYWRPVDLDWMHLCCRMMAVPQIKLNKAILEAGLEKEIQKKADVLDDLLNQMQLSQISIPDEARKPKRKSDPPLTDREAVAKIVGSTQQCAELLQAFGCEVPEKYSDKQQKMVPALAKSDHEFTSLVDSPIPGVPELVAARLGIKSTIMQSRIERFLGVAQRMDGGYLPVPIVPFHAHTGRCSGAQRCNVQNLSARKSANNPDGKRNAIRLAMEAPPGYFLVDGDLSQIEVRTLGALSGEQNILRPFSIKGFDPYCDFGRKFYGYEIDPVRDKDKRQGMKAAVLGNGYGQGAAGYQIYARSMGAILTMEEAEAIVKTYRREHPQVVAFWRQCDEALNWIEQGREGTFGYRGCLRVYKNAIILPSGRPIYYRNLQYRQVLDPRTNSYKRERMFYDPVKHTYRRVYGSLVAENVTQGAAADVIYAMGVDLSNQGLFPALQVHDSLVFIVPDTPEWRQYARTTIPTCMRTVPAWLPWLPLDSSYEEGPNYGETEELKDVA